MMKTWKTDDAISRIKNTLPACLPPGQLADAEADMMTSTTMDSNVGWSWWKGMEPLEGYTFVA